jgi:hypothetical protein
VLLNRMAVVLLNRMAVLLKRMQDEDESRDENPQIEIQ